MLSVRQHFNSFFHFFTSVIQPKTDTYLIIYSQLLSFLLPGNKKKTTYWSFIQNNSEWGLEHTKAPIRCPKIDLQPVHYTPHPECQLDKNVNLTHCNFKEKEDG